MTINPDTCCAYCHPGPGLFEKKIEVIKLRASTVYLSKDAYYPGRCFVVSNRHVNELFELESNERQLLIDEACRVALAIKQIFHADKINYGIFGDTVPHLHLHLVPKVKHGPQWGEPFLSVPPVERPIPAHELEEYKRHLIAALVKME